MKKIITCSMLLVLFSCSSKKREQTASFETIYTSYYGGNEVESHLVVEDSIAFDKEISRLGMEEEINNFPVIDFKKNNVIFLHLGLRNTGGYAIDVEKVALDDDELIVYQKIISPLKGENVTMALTNPYCIVKIPKAEKNIVK